MKKEDFIMGNSEQKQNKYDTAIGLFWAVSLFIGILVAFITGIRGNGHSDWIFAAIIGAHTFLIIGLTAQFIVTLARKD
jgi:hypothetical protein